MELLAALGSITFINLILSGDNAVIIALASRNLPPAQRKKAVIWGSAGAVILRIVLTLVAALLLKIPYVQFAGGLALLYIAINLLAEDKKEVSCQEASSFMEAVKIILFADLIMSLDNVLAIAGIADGNMMLLIFGLAMSIPLVVFGSQMLMTLMDRFPIIIYVGAGILGWTAAKMIVADQALGAMLQPYALMVEIGLTALVIAVGHWRKTRGHKEAITGSETTSFPGDTEK
ncbi:Integral membrane protein TerC [Thermosinus carboxydivorans Nor1]|uniref:Integral membrane protein TerC n=1 Tax=Thermosinus carboxydivorans Nor1 TaxID=401526 RepID=A1HQY4_9FIRM|nr:TerC family protein [Thermosinus carboxydivorans]EAX47492.1 Integral membrane protein TerC [Thermosinus carboxydivorans Nor1]